VPDARGRRVIGDLGLLVPIRCFTCGKLIGDKFADFETRVKAGEDPGKVLDDLGISRYCCRRMMITSVDLIDQVLPYYQQKNPGP
jgi:DNA-directed RNA polymerase subunit N